jgi:hypothetical protein
MPTPYRFSRAAAPLGHTLALQSFRRDFSKLNEHYWAYLPARIISERAASQVAPTTSMPIFTTSSNADLTRCSHDTREWLVHIRESENWTRLSALTFLLSTLEVYLRAVIRAALASDPLLIPGFPKRVDGVVLLRLGRLRVPEDMISKCVKGAWNERVLAYTSTFGHPPDELSSSISGLEAMRKLRNQFAHESGRDALTSQRGAPAQAYAGLRAIDRIRLSEQRLKAFLGIVFSVASAVDGHLETSYVGDWEMLELFHLWKTNLRALEAALGSAANEAERRVDNGLIKMLARTTDIQIPGKPYFNGLTKYYSACS